MKIKNLEEELVNAGYTKGRERFETILLETHSKLFPDRSDEDLMSEPLDALRFCVAVQLKTVLSLPNHVICKGLINIRKQGRLAVRNQEE